MRRTKTRRVSEPVVAITEGPDHAQALSNALDLLPLDRVFRAGDVVLVKPNLVTAAGPDSGIVTRPSTLRTVLRRIKQTSPGRLVVVEGSGGSTTPETLRASGLDQVIAEEEVEHVDLNTGPYVDLPLEGDVFPSIKVNRIVESADVLVSLAVLKAHLMATVTLGLKNVAVGFASAEFHGHPKGRLGLHDHLHTYIAAMGRALPIDLSIISAETAMIGTGPTLGKVVRTDLVLAGTDPLATDIVGAGLLGFRYHAVQYLDLARRQGQGEADLNRVSFPGLPYEAACRLFTARAYGKEFCVAPS